MVLSGLLLVALLGDVMTINTDNNSVTQQNIIVSGTWYGNDGLYYAIEQQGNSLRIGGYNAGQQLRLSGSGSINGQLIQISFHYGDGSGGSAQLTDTPDGQSMSGNLIQHATGYTGIITLNRFGGTR